ncbi:hypothetical protein L1987_48485 [Smallanthus sonchifolius]|uniref:Uncharacterized protein n=1 Tax=Smallanthus sonchifolius TaxID=185202 RepID=A0ACB9FSJ4_9ASTR|nr:hypothetical protein L1987_48485 [Smallanthus sonchifolius]
MLVPPQLLLSPILLLLMAAYQSSDVEEKMSSEKKKHVETEEVAKVVNAQVMCEEKIAEKAKVSKKVTLMAEDKAEKKEMKQVDAEAAREEMVQSFMA